jgi:hypothetical protein
MVNKNGGAIKLSYVSLSTALPSSDFNIASMRSASVSLFSNTRVNLWLL